MSARKWIVIVAKKCLQMFIISSQLRKMIIWKRLYRMIRILLRNWKVSVESMDNMPRQPSVNGGIRRTKFANFTRREISLKSGKSSNDAAGGLQNNSILGSQSETYSDRICNGYMDEPLDLTVKGKGTTPEDSRPVYITTNNIGETSSLLQLQEKFGTNSTIFDRIGARTSNQHGPSYGQDILFFVSRNAIWSNEKWTSVACSFCRCKETDQ